MARGTGGSRGGDSGDFKSAMDELTRAIRELSERQRQADAKQTYAQQVGSASGSTPGGPGSAPSAGLTGRNLGTRASTFLGEEGGSGAGGLSEFGGGAGLGASVLGAIPGLLAGAGSYAAQRTPFGTTGTTDMLGQNLEMGVLKGIASAAAPIPVIGDFLQNQFKGLEEAVYAPEERARGKLSPVFERMAMAGIDVSDQEMSEAAQFAIPIERKAVYAKQRFERISAAVNADNGAALGGALNSIGL